MKFTNVAALASLVAAVTALPVAEGKNVEKQRLRTDPN